MFENIEPHGFITEPTDEFRTDIFDCRCTTLIQVPIARILTPGDCLEPENAFGDRPDAIIDITKRRPPVAGDSTTVSVSHELHAPSELA